MINRITTAALVGLVSALLSSGANAEWVSARNGDVPEGTLISGQESNGEKLYECRANYKGGVHPGKVRKAFGACNIGWGGKEVAIKQYETYVVWKRASNGEVPSTAIVGGSESDGTKIYICRGNYNGGVHPGKVRSEFGACNISWGGNEVKLNPYEVFVQ